MRLLGPKEVLQRRRGAEIKSLSATNQSLCPLRGKMASADPEALEKHPETLIKIIVENNYDPDE